MNFFKEHFGKIFFIILSFIVIVIGYKKSFNRASVVAKSSIYKKDKINPELQESDVQEIVKKYILENPEVIIQSLENLRKENTKKMEEQIQGKINLHKKEIEDTSNTPYAGNKDGDVVVTVFLDYNCPYCKKANDFLNQLINLDVGVKVAYKLYSILGELSEYSGKVMFAIYKLYPDKFKKVHDEFMSSPTKLTKENIAKILNQNSISVEEVEKFTESSDVNQGLAEVNNLGKEIGINGAPAFIIGGKLYPGLVDLNSMKQIIKEIREKKN